MATQARERQPRPFQKPILSPRSHAPSPRRRRSSMLVCATNSIHAACRVGLSSSSTHTKSTKRARNLVQRPHGFDRAGHRHLRLRPIVAWLVLVTLLTIAAASAPRRTTSPAGAGGRGMRLKVSCAPVCQGILSQTSSHESTITGSTDSAL